MIGAKPQQMQSSDSTAEFVHIWKRLPTLNFGLAIKNSSYPDSPNIDLQSLFNNGNGPNTLGPIIQTVSGLLFPGRAHADNAPVDLAALTSKASSLALQSLGVSPGCSNDLLLLLHGLMGREAWALTVLDAFGKPDSGIMQGRIWFPGGFDECQGVNTSVYNNATETTDQFTGKYCRLDIPTGVASFDPAAESKIRVGLCVSGRCNVADLTKLIEAVPHKPTVDTGISNGKNAFVPHDQKNDLPTVYTVKADKHVNIGKSSIEPVSQQHSYGTMERILLAFSVYSNGVKILNTDQREGSLGALNGIRFLSMAWVILGHTLAFAIGLDANLFQFAYEQESYVYFCAIMYATVSVDSFFTLSGVLVAYLTLRELKKVGGAKRLNWLMFYFHRFWRLTPPYMLVLMFGTVLSPYLIMGPLRLTNDIMGECRKNWWTNLLYINNYVELDHWVCMGWSWYLANDMQFYIISPLILLPLFYNVFAGAVSCLVFLSASLAARWVIAYQHEYPSLNLLLWFLSFATFCLVVYGPYSRDGNHIFSLGESSAYTALSRTAWGVALAYLIIACCTGHGGWINELLSWPGFIPLSRLTYCAYLIHPLVMITFHTSRRQLTYFTQFELIYLFLGHMTLTYGLSFIVSLVFEAPMMGLEKAVLGKGRK
ncbi:NRF6-like protein [Mya arenaria]|uniref:NRF6-like protein n=1 Tax=Mya arenaria TaxID=6604 RepID=A0ABY7ESF1_MYAAR|nr:NRF6-like protein [Mya arenaria]